MEELYPFLQTDIPDEVMVDSFMVLCIVVVLVFVFVKNTALMRRLVLGAMLLEYIAMVLALTIFVRPVFQESRYILEPFYSYSSDEYGIMFQCVLNMVLFIPTGFMLGGILKIYGWFYAFACAFCLSCGIELSQLFLKRGICETDDVIHNTLGCLIGYGLYRMIILGLI